MTLAQWSAKQPYTLNKHMHGQYWIPDAASLVDRAQAWRLSDYLVSTVSGGTIWFYPREERTS